MSMKSKSKKEKSILVADYNKNFIWLELPRNRGFTSFHANGIVAILDKFNRLGAKRVVFYICGPGGDFFAFLKVAQKITSFLGIKVVFVPFGFVKSGCFWLTQVGSSCLVLPGTRLAFHHTVDIPVSGKSIERSMSQQDYFERMSRLMRIDAIQLMYFTRRGKPISKVFNLFDKKAVLTPKEAIRLGLCEKYYSKNLFEKHKHFVDVGINNAR